MANGIIRIINKWRAWSGNRGRRKPQICCGSDCIKRFGGFGWTSPATRNSENGKVWGRLASKMRNDPTQKKVVELN